MFVKSIHKPNVSSSITSFYWPACVVVLLILGTLAGTSVADTDVVGTWNGQWESGGYEGVAINWVALADDSVTGSWEQPLEPFELSGTATANVSGTYTYSSAGGLEMKDLKGTVTVQQYTVKINLTVYGQKTDDNTIEGDSQRTYDVYEGGELIESYYADGTYRVTRTPQLSFAVTSPNGGESWEQGTSHTITWTSSGNVGSNVKIELYKGTQLNLTVASSTANDGSHNWNIPAGQTPGSDYRIKVTSNLNYYDVSDGYFSITAPTPTPDSYEPDESYTLAKRIYSGIPQTHSIFPADDIDWVTFSLSTESQVVIETSGPAGDTQMFLFDTSDLIEEDDDSGDDYFSRIDRLFRESNPLQAGTYYVAIVENGLDEEIASYDITFTIVIGDFCGANFTDPDGYVDVWDLMEFADHWHTCFGEGNWDEKYDLTGPNFGDIDDYVDVWDLMLFADNWHTGVKPP